MVFILGRGPIAFTAMLSVKPIPDSIHMVVPRAVSVEHAVGYVVAKNEGAGQHDICVRGLRFT